MNNFNRKIIEYYDRYDFAYHKSYPDDIIQLYYSKEMLITLGIKLGINSKTNILDCGSGYGYPARLFSDCFGCNVLGLNISKVQLEYSKKYEGNKVYFIEHDFDDIDKITDKYDIIMFLQSFGYSKNQEQLLTKCYDRLNDGGRLIIRCVHFIGNVDDYAYNICFYKLLPIDKMIRLLVNSGFKVIDYGFIEFGHSSDFNFAEIVGIDVDIFNKVIPYYVIVVKN